METLLRKEGTATSTEALPLLEIIGLIGIPPSPNQGTVDLEAVVKGMESSIGRPEVVVAATVEEAAAPR